MSLEIGQVAQNGFAQDYASKVGQYTECNEKTGNYFTDKLTSKVESMTGKTLEEMQEEVAQRREGIEQAIKDKDLDTAVDLITEDGLMGKMFKFGWDTGKSIGNFLKKGLFGY